VFDTFHYGVDLHIHTPASSDYKGIKSEEEYINILKQAKENNIELLCIADHITVAGYKKIMDLKNKTSELLGYLHKRTDISKSILNSVEQEYELFNSIHVLMGVEINVSPGIHYIIIFKETVTSKRVEDFLVSIIKGELS